MSRKDVADELAELRQKIDKLSEFTRSSACKEISLIQQELLIRQFDAMQAYAEVLADRLFDLSRNKD